MSLPSARTEPPAPLHRPRPAAQVMAGQLAGLARPRADLGNRLVAGSVALLAWAVLALASMLTPRADGYGTHEQLGLPPCQTKMLTGYPCPSCGMTTAFAAFVRGDLPAALRAHLLGAVLAAATLLAALGGTLMAVTGINLGPVLARMFVGRNEWLYLLAVLGLGSWALKVVTGW